MPNKSIDTIVQMHRKSFCVDYCKLLLWLKQLKGSKNTFGNKISQEVKASSENVFSQFKRLMAVEKRKRNVKITRPTDLPNNSKNRCGGEVSRTVFMASCAKVYTFCSQKSLRPNLTSSQCTKRSEEIINRIHIHTGNHGHKCSQCSVEPPRH